MKRNYMQTEDTLTHLVWLKFNQSWSIDTTRLPTLNLAVAYFFFFFLNALSLEQEVFDYGNVFLGFFRKKKRCIVNPIAC